MASNQNSAQRSDRQQQSVGDDFLLRAANHRCSNDLQLIISLLALQARRSQSDETKEALTDAMNRVALLARSRSTAQQHDLTLGGALRQLCDAISAYAEPRGILVSLEAHYDCRLSSR